MTLDHFDYKILSTLQNNADYSMAELGDIVGLSHTPCWRRYKKLKDQGYIQEKVVVLNPQKLGICVSIHCYIRILAHDEPSLNAFESAVHDIDEIVECHSVSGEWDYILRVIVKSVADYELLLKGTLLHLPNVASINSTFDLKQIKYTTKLPFLTP